MENEVKAPQGTAFILTVPLDRENTKQAVYFLREIDEVTFMGAASMIDVKKTFDAIRLIVKTLALPGSDDYNILKDNFIALMAAAKQVPEMMQVEGGSLKKN